MTDDTTTLTVQREGLLRFLDEKPACSSGHATAFVSVVGEDLNAACFRNYTEAKGAKVDILAAPVTTGRTQGPRLDRWIAVDQPGEGKFLYQTEIKNWSAHAIGGEVLPVSTGPEELANYKRRRWTRHWDLKRRTLKGASCAKVLVPMKPPDGFEGFAIRPLLIFWEPIGNIGKRKEPLFRVPVTANFPFQPAPSWQGTDTFKELWVFSVSCYLRDLTEDSIRLPMPDAAFRLQALNRLFT